jgi:hypothetical protein
MPGMNHDFFLVSQKQYSIRDYSPFLRIPGTVQIHDDLIWYFSDTFAWIPCYNPSTDQPHQGFCYYGVTVINEQGAEVAGQVFRQWANLFAIAPEIVCLTGMWTYPASEDDYQKEGEYQKLKYDRQDLIQKFEKLEAFTHQILLDKGESFILHLGI